MKTISEILAGTGYAEHQIADFMTESYLDFIFFAKHMFGFDIADYHKEWYDLFEKYNRVCIASFRGSGKTNFTSAYLVWKAIFHKIKVLIVSATFEQAKMVLRIMRDMITGNEILRQYLPETREGAWRATELNLRNGSVIYSRTYGESVKGLRIDFLLADEAGDYADKSIFWTSVSPVVQLNMGKIFVIGTTTSMFDLLHDLQKNDEYYYAEYPVEKDGKPLWEAKYTMKEEDEEGKRSIPKIRKEIGELAFMQEYMLKPISIANSFYPYEIINNAINEHETFLKYGKINENYYVGVDLALSMKGDYNVYTVVQSNSSGKKLVYGERFRGSIDEQKKRLINIYENFKPTKILMDKTGLGEALYRDFSAIIPKVAGVTFTSEEKYKILMNLRYELERGGLLIPYSKEDTTAYNFVNNLLKELTDITIKITETGKIKFFGGKYDDAVISLALAVYASKDAGRLTNVEFL